jgi:isocitrate dehydrogenase
MAEKRSPSASSSVVVPVMPGDGVGPELWQAARPVLDAAIHRAYGGHRRIEWREGTLEQSLEWVKKHRVALVGPHALAGGTRVSLFQEDTGQEIRRAGPFPVGNPVWVWHPIPGRNTVEFAPAAFETDGLLRALRAVLPERAKAIRFGTRERVDSYLRSVGVSEAGFVEVALAVATVGMTDTLEVVSAAVDWALMEGHREAVLVFDDSVWKGSDDPQFSVFGALPAIFGDCVLTGWHLDRVRMLEGDRAAEELLAEVRKSGVFLEFAPLGTFLKRALSGVVPPLIITTESAATSVVGALAHRAGGAKNVAVTQLSADRSVAMFGTLHGTCDRLAGKNVASPLGLLFAGAELLAHLGWKEAAVLVTERVAAAARVQCDGTTAEEAAVAVTCS